MGKIKKFVFIMPIVGLFVSLLLFVYYFGIVGVEEQVWIAALYCALPFLLYTLLYFPLCIYFKSSLWEENRERKKEEA